MSYRAGLCKVGAEATNRDGEARMCRWVAYLGEPIFLEEFVTTPRQSLIVQSRHSREAKNAVNGDGCGLGWYGDRRAAGAVPRRAAGVERREPAVARAPDQVPPLFCACPRLDRYGHDARQLPPFQLRQLDVHAQRQGRRLGHGCGGRSRPRSPTRCFAIARAPPTARSYFSCCWPTASKKTRKPRAPRPCGSSRASCARPASPSPCG